MDKAQMMNLLRPFIRGEVPKDEQWYKSIHRVARQIPRQDTSEAISILESMFHNPLDQNSKPENDVPGAHGLYQEMTARQVSFRNKERR